MTHDFGVIGGGIVGLATAMNLLARRPGASLVLLEKEQSLGVHQTGHNSGVIHSGIYYAPGSLKAELCRRGERATKAFCAEHGIPFETCGKLLVATDEAEERRMDALYERARVNGIEVERLDRAELRRREPHIEGRAALFVKATGIVDYRRVAAQMGEVIRGRGGALQLGAAVSAIREESDSVRVRAGGAEWTVRRLVVCGGLQSDRLAALAGLPVRHRIVPFRGEYFRLPPERAGLIRALIYPVPDPELPFLGVHLTRMIDGTITVGPNAVLGLARERYPKLSVTFADVGSAAAFPGFWRMLWRHRRFAAGELRNSLSKRAYLQECRKYCPELQLADLRPHPAGIRAQAVLHDGSLVHDFLFLETARMLHVANAPSPGATSAIPIGEAIAGKVLGG